MSNYKNGLKFDSSLQKSLRYQINRVVVENKASMIIIDGQVGEGKTTLATETADEICNILTNEYNLPQTFDIKSQVCMGGESFKEGLLKCYKDNKNVIIYDESGDFSSRRAMTDFNNRLNRVFETYRAFKVIVILCLPCFRTLDSSLMLKGIPRLLIHTYGRNKNYGNYKVYCYTYMCWVHDRLSKEVVPSFAYSKQKPNFYGHFLDLEPERSKELAEHCLGGKLRILEEKLEKPKQSEDTTQNNNISVTEAGKLLGKPTAKIRDLCKEKDINVFGSKFKFITLEDFEFLKSSI